MKISPSLKVGILTIVAIVILVLSILWLKGRAISTGTRIDVEFNDVDGLRPGAPVQMMGIRIGQIEEVSPVIQKDKSNVKVKFVITEMGINIPTASEISIQQSGIIGEKFLEITPPRIKYTFIPITKSSKEQLYEKAPVELLVDGTYLTVGDVKSTEVINTNTLSLELQEELKSSYAYKIGYIIELPSISVPDKSTQKIAKRGAEATLRFTPPENVIVNLPDVDSEYTIVEPMRLRDFFDLQIKAAKSLNATNDKINSLLSQESIDDIKETIRNIKTITGKAETTVDKANLLMETSRIEIYNAMNLAENLSNKLTLLSDNLNDIVGDKEFKGNLIDTTKSINKATNKLSDLLSDKDTAETLQYLNLTSKNLSEVSSYINEMTKDKELKVKFTHTVTNMNNSLEKLTETLNSVNSLTTDEQIEIKQMLKDTSETSRNLRKFSDKLNKRFLIFRLMF